MTGLEKIRWPVRVGFRPLHVGRRTATTRQWRYFPKADRRDLYPARFDSKRSWCYPYCRGDLKINAAIEEPAVIVRIASARSWRADRLLSAETAARDQLFAGEPAGVVGSEENGDCGDVVRLAGAAQRGLSDKRLFE